MATRQQVIKSQVEKEQQKFEARMKKLQARLEAEEIKNAPVTMDQEGVKELMAQVDSVCEVNKIDKLKLFDFMVKKGLGETAKVVHRRARKAKTESVPVIGKKK